MQKLAIIFVLITIVETMETLLNAFAPTNLFKRIKLKLTKNIVFPTKI
jgi:hypothetical protein